MARFTRERLLRCLGTAKARKIATYADTPFSAGEVTTYVNSACSSAVAVIRAIGSGMVGPSSKIACKGPLFMSHMIRHGYDLGQSASAGTVHSSLHD